MEYITLGIAVLFLRKVVKHERGIDFKMACKQRSEHHYGACDSGRMDKV